jgi:hypothetical protein
VSAFSGPELSTLTTVWLAFPSALPVIDTMARVVIEQVGHDATVGLTVAQDGLVASVSAAMIHFPSPVFVCLCKFIVLKALRAAKRGNTLFESRGVTAQGDAYAMPWSAVACVQ